MSSLKCVLRTCAFVLPTLSVASALAAPNEAAFPDESAPTAPPPAVAPTDDAAAEDDPFQEAAAAPAPSSDGYVGGAVTPSSPGAAGEPDDSASAEDPADPDEGLRNVSLTFSPLHLFMPMLELTAEVRLARKFGVAALGGYGQITGERDPGDTREPLTATVYEIGAQARYYVFGSFDHGMQLGAEVLYLHLDADTTGSIVASGEGLAVGPFAGYKIATQFGFTFDGQLGIQYLAARAEAHDTDTNDSAEASDSVWIPLLNVNVGWSF